MVNVFLMFLIFTLAANFIGSSGQQKPLEIDTPIPDFVFSSGWDMAGNNSKKVIKILASTMYDGLYPLKAVTTVVGRLALDRLRALPYWLRNYEIALEVYDDKGEDSAVIGGLVTKLRENNETEGRFPLAALTDCSQVGIVMSAYIMKPMNFIGFNGFPADARFYFERENFSNYFSIGERGDYYFIAVAKFLKKMNWNKVAIISDLAPFNNMLDGRLVDSLEESNITLLYMGKTQFQTEDEYELSSTFEEMLKRQPRIILSESLTPVTIACYLHRYGMYGPNYVVFTLAWNSFDENAEIPFFLRSWCTKEMIRDVLASFIFYGDTTVDEIYGPEAAVDSTGLSPGAFFDFVANSVDHPETAIAWQYWAPVYYDRYISIGLILNETETELNKRHMTLLDWTTNSRNFQENGEEIVEILKQSIYRFSADGIKGDYSFDPITGWSSGSMPISFKQMVVENGTSRGNIVGYYKSNRKYDPLIIHWEAFTWRTLDKTPPKDALEIVIVQLPLIPFAANVVLKLIAAIEALVALFLLMVMLFLTRGMRNDLLMVLSDVILPCTVLIIPMSPTPDVARHCTAITVVLLNGFCLLILACGQKLDALNTLKKMAIKTGRSSKIAMTVVNATNHQERRIDVRRVSTISRVSAMHNLLAPSLTRWQILFCISSTSAQTILYGIVFVLAPVRTKNVDFPLVMSSTDEDVAYQLQRLECGVLESMFESEASITLSALTVGFQLVSLIRAMCQSLGLQSNKHQWDSKSISEAKRLPVFIYCTMVFLFASGFLLILDPGNGLYLTILMACFVILTTAANILIVAIPNDHKMFFKALCFWKADGIHRSASTASNVGKS